LPGRRYRHLVLAGLKGLRLEQNRLELTFLNINRSNLRKARNSKSLPTFIATEKGRKESLGVDLGVYA
jgi:hypothetical protein